MRGFIHNETTICRHMPSISHSAASAGNIRADLTGIHLVCDQCCQKKSINTVSVSTHCHYQSVFWCVAAEVTLSLYWPVDKHAMIKCGLSSVLYLCDEKKNKCFSYNNAVGYFMVLPSLVREAFAFLLWHMGWNSLGKPGLLHISATLIRPPRTLSLNIGSWSRKSFSFFTTSSGKENSPS